MEDEFIDVSQERVCSSWAHRVGENEWSPAGTSDSTSSKLLPCHYLA